MKTKQCLRCHHPAHPGKVCNFEVKTKWVIMLPSYTEKKDIVRCGCGIYDLAEADRK